MKNLLTTAQIYEVSNQYFQYLLYDFRYAKETIKLSSNRDSLNGLCMRSANAFNYIGMALRYLYFAITFISLEIKILYINSFNLCNNTCYVAYTLCCTKLTVCASVLNRILFTQVGFIFTKKSGYVFKTLEGLLNNSEKEQSRSFTLSYFNPYYKVIVIRTVWY